MDALVLRSRNNDDVKRQATIGSDLKVIIDGRRENHIGFRFINVKRVRLHEKMVKRVEPLCVFPMSQVTRVTLTLTMSQVTRITLTYVKVTRVTLTLTKVTRV